VVAIELPNHLGERVERRNKIIIGGLHCEEVEGGTGNSEQHIVHISGLANEKKKAKQLSNHDCEQQVDIRIRFLT